MEDVTGVDFGEGCHYFPTAATGRGEYNIVSLEQKMLQQHHHQQQQQQARSIPSPSQSHSSPSTFWYPSLPFGTLLEFHT